jgi:hypothetical protein
MQKICQVLVVTLTATLILLTANAPVNHRPATPTGRSTAPVADGIPMPPPPTKKPGAAIVIADGIPMPPPPPTKKPGAFA